MRSQWRFYSASIVATLVSLAVMTGCAGRPTAGAGQEASTLQPAASPPAPAATRPAHLAPKVGPDVPPAVAQALVSWKAQALDRFLAPDQPETARLLDYSIDSITLHAKQDAGDVYMVKYSVLPAEPYKPSGPITTQWRAGAGQLEADGWVRAKVNLVKVIPDGNAFRFEDGLP